MRRLLACIITLVMIVSCVSTLAEEIETVAPVYDYHQLVVGGTTAMSGNFFSGVFGNNAADLDVQQLLHGYNLVQWDTEVGGFATNDSVISGISVSDNALGDRTYTLALYQDMYYSDGTQITAWDYAFSILLNAAPELAAIGGSTNGSEAIMGMAEYMQGTESVLSGVHVANQFMIAITVKHEYQPFFYELGLLNYCPYPISQIAPGCSVKDDGKGIYIDPRSEFNAQQLANTLLDPEHGYVSHPAVVSGPYCLTSFDGVTAEFEINPYYKGDNQGRLPLIEKLVYTYTTNDTIIADLASTKLGLVNKAVSAATINEGIGNIGNGYYAMTNYTRSGLGYISFCCEKATVGDVNVRKALALCMDKDMLVDDYVSDYGLRVDGYYGIGQWMYQLISGVMTPPMQELDDHATAKEKKAYEETQKAWDELNLDGLVIYDLDIEAANRLLDEAGWNLNAEGNTFDAAVDEIRCKMIDGELVALDLKLIVPAGNKIIDSLKEHFALHCAQAGMRVTVEAMPMAELLKRHYRQTERDTDMIFLATNFRVVFDPSLTYSTEAFAQNVYNTSAIADEKLYELTVDMRKTDPGDLLSYCRKWVAFQEYWTEVLPAIPLYSNIYFDFYTANLHDYQINESVTWTQAIIGAYMGDIEEDVQDTEELEETEEGFEIFD